MTMTHPVHTEHEHAHDSGCGHVGVDHDGHTDYLHDGHAHRLHEDHWDECEPAAHVTHVTHVTHDHTHGAGCGHDAVDHDGHTDYLHDGHRHADHDGHWDEH